MKSSTWSVWMLRMRRKNVFRKSCGLRRLVAGNLRSHCQGHSEMADREGCCQHSYSALFSACRVWLCPPLCTHTVHLLLPCCAWGFSLPGQPHMAALSFLHLLVLLLPSVRFPITLSVAPSTFLTVSGPSCYSSVPWSVACP